MFGEAAAATDGRGVGVGAPVEFCAVAKPRVPSTRAAPTAMATIFRLNRRELSADGPVGGVACGCAGACGCATTSDGAVTCGCAAASGCVCTTAGVATFAVGGRFLFAVEVAGCARLFNRRPNRFMSVPHSRSESGTARWYLSTLVGRHRTYQHDA